MTDVVQIPNRTTQSERQHFAASQPVGTVLGSQRDSKSRSIISRIVEFESGHPVEDYKYGGWWVWPFLRTWTSRQMFCSRPSGKISTEINKSKVQRQSLPKRILQHAQSLLRPHLTDQRKMDSLSAQTSVVFATSSNRREDIAGELWHRHADPLAAALENTGRRLSVWEAGMECGPRRSKSVWIGGRIAFNERFSKRRGEKIPANQPSWYDEYATWASREIGQDLPWTQWFARLRNVERMSALFERWLRRCNASAVIIDCWYSWRSMAITLAAQRLGLRTVEWQHGIQGAAHPGYAMWTKGIRSSPGVVPDVFWVWGQADAEVLTKTIHDPPRVVVGGNLWLNQWRTAEHFPGIRKPIENITRNASHTILVTTQPSADFALIEKAIEKSPSEWKWLVRLHPKMLPRLDEYRIRLEQMRVGSVDVINATKLPLYAILRDVDIHVTGFSTCALEASALGTYSVIIDPAGIDWFGDLINNRLMGHARTSEELLRCIGTPEVVDKEKLAMSVNRQFAKTDDVIEKLNEALGEL